MVHSLTYRRPAFVSSGSSSSQGSLRSDPSTLSPAGIPDALSFHHIISGGTCPPCTIRDFINYLMYIEFAAENLQFYLWYKDYVKRFDSLPGLENTLSPPIATERQSIDLSGFRYPASPTSNRIFKESTFDKKQSPIDDYLRDEKGSVSSKDSEVDSPKKDHCTATANAFEAADINFRPFTIQPYREEISRIVATYIADGGPRQLNLSSKERGELLYNLAATTHPSAFLPVLRTVEWNLKHQAHPNFIRWSISNGNRSRCLFARGLGVFCVIIGLVVLVFLTASDLNRAWRVLGSLPLFLGISTMFAAWKGMCVVLHGMHHRQLRPWELFLDENEAASELELMKGSLDSSETMASYEDKPWVARYQQRSLIRKVFDREVWIEEPALRQIQDTIFLQSLLLALIITVIVVGVFCTLPPGRMY